MDPSIIVGIVTVVGSLLLNIPAFRLTRQQQRKEAAAANKTGAETADVQVGTSLDLMREMRTDIADLKKRLRRLEIENVWLRNGVGVLISQLQKHDITPEFTLDSIPEMEE